MPRASLRVSAALVRDTFREALARKVFWGLFGLSTALILFFLFIMRIDVVEGARATVSLFGQPSGKATEVAKLVRQVHAGIASFLYSAAMFLAVFASAGLVPTIFEAGRIELLLSKPVARYHILLGRYLGNLLVVTLNICYLVAGVWLIFGWKTGIWNKSFLNAILTSAFMFAVLLSAIILVSVLSESAALAIMIAFGLMVVSPILAQHEIMVKLLSSEWSRQVWKGLYYALPKVFDVGRMNMDLVMGRPVGSLAPVWSSAAFAVVMLGAGVYSFSKRNF
jgi:ABC-type transport system involved in multi-copper enzyme maturation permease subunit